MQRQPKDAQALTSRHFLRRVAALLIDGIVLAALGTGVLALVSVAAGPSVTFAGGAVAAASLGWRAVLNSSLLGAVSAAYFVGCWTRYGATLGQALLGLRVTGPSGERPGGGIALLRWTVLGMPVGVLMAALVDAPLAFAAVMLLAAGWTCALVATTLLSRSGRGLHDRIAATSVESRRSRRT